MWKKIKEHLVEIYLYLLCIALVCVGLYMMAAHGIPLGEQERDMKKVTIGGQFVLMGMGFALFIWLIVRLLETFFRWMENRYGKYEDYMNPEKWPPMKKRTVQKILTKMWGRPYLLVWDSVQGGVLFSMVLSWLVTREVGMAEMLQTLVGIIIFAGIGHILWVLFYKRRNYTAKLIKCTECYLGPLEQETFLADLQDDLQNRMQCYLNMWIVTENYFIGWAETELSFCPVAISRTQIEKINTRVSTKSFGYGKKSVCPVLICTLQNGKVVELFAGGNFQIEAVWRLLQLFEGDKLV